MMIKNPVFLASLALAAGLLAACASMEGSEGPTVAVAVDTIPGNTRIYVDDTRAGDSPTKVNLLVDAEGRLAYDVDITADFSASHVAQALGRPTDGSKSQNEPVFVRLKKGEIPPAQISFSGGFGTKQGQSLTLNPPTVRSSAVGRIGDRDPIQSMLALNSEDSAATDTTATTTSAAAAGGGAAGLGGAAAGGGRGGR
jgi:hypothetical protein